MPDCRSMNVRAGRSGSLPFTQQRRAPTPRQRSDSLQPHALVAESGDDLELTTETLDVAPQRRQEVIVAALGFRQLRLVHLQLFGQLDLGLAGELAHSAQVQ